MGKYSAGIATQEKIVNSAKKLFYSNGYKKTTIKDICEDADVLRTVFCYYFRDKGDLADHISDYINDKISKALFQEILSNHQPIDDLLLSIYSSTWFFYNIMCDIHLNVFYAEVLVDNSKMLLGNDFYRKIFQSLYRCCGKKPNSKEFELFFTYSTAVPGVFLYRYLTKSFQLTKEEIVEYLHRKVLCSLDIPEQKQDQIIADAFVMVKASKISFKEIFLEPYFIKQTN